MVNARGLWSVTESGLLRLMQEEEEGGLQESLDMEVDSDDEDEDERGEAKAEEAKAEEGMVGAEAERTSGAAGQQQNGQQQQQHEGPDEGVEVVEQPLKRLKRDSGKGKRRESKSTPTRAAVSERKTRQTTPDPVWHGVTESACGCCAGGPSEAGEVRDVPGECEAAPP